MAALQDQRTQSRDPQEPGYPEAIAGYIVYLKQLYPPIHLREIERILLRKFGFKTNHHTIRRFLAPYETRSNLSLISPPSPPMTMPTRLAGKWCGWHLKAGTKKV